MALNHVVLEGDCMTSIAETYGFFWSTLWNDPLNESVKTLRKDPNTLVPGDSVYIPDKRPKNEARPTGHLHRFRKRGVPAIFRLQLFDNSGKYRANQPFEIVIDGRKVEGVTNAEGVLQVSIPSTAALGQLVIGSDRATYSFSFGRLQPVTEITGVQQRLTNLGFDCGQISGELDEQTRLAVRAFQETCGLTASGEPDGATRTKLDALHDQVCDIPQSAKATDDGDEIECQPEPEGSTGTPAGGQPAVY